MTTRSIPRPVWLAWAAGLFLVSGVRVFGVRTTDFRDDMAVWKCACRQDCDEPMVASFLKSSGSAVSTCDPVLVSNDVATCRQILVFEAVDEAKGRSCITYAAALDSCNAILGHWWSLITQGQEKVPASTLVARAAIDLRNEPLREWALTQKADVSSELFLQEWSPTCVDVILQVFQGGEYTSAYGGGVLTKVLGPIRALAEPMKNLDHLMFGYLGSAEAIARARGALKPLKIGPKDSPLTVRELPGFATMRAHFGVPEDFLLGFVPAFDFAAKRKGGTEFVAGSGSSFQSFGDYLVKCEHAGNWHGPVDFRSFYAHSEKYFEYMLDEGNQDTLLPRFFTAFVSPFAKRGEAFCFVMQDLRAGFLRAHWYKSVDAAAENFDFKGSVIITKRGDTNSRLTRHEVGKPFSPNDHPVFKDLNFIDREQLYLPEEVSIRLLGQIDQDLKFLGDRLLMDYSFYVHRVRVGSMNLEVMSDMCPLRPLEGRLFGSAFQQDRGYLAAVTTWNHEMLLYGMGLIDVLQPYSLFKAVDNAYDHLVFPQQSGDFAMNNIASDKYATRFRKFMSNIVAASAQDGQGTKELSVQFANAACGMYQTVSDWGGFSNRLSCEAIGLVDRVPGVRELLANARSKAGKTHPAFNAMGVQDTQCSSAPTAVYIIGPPSVGKGDVIFHSPEGFARKVLDFKLDDASWVRVHGSKVREVDVGYQKLREVAERHGCRFDGGWDQAKSNLIKKITVQSASAEPCKRNIVISEQSSQWREISAQAKELRDKGYSVHVVGLFADATAALAQRAVGLRHVGDAYRQTYIDSLVGIVPAMAGHTGSCQLIDVTGALRHGFVAGKLAQLLKRPCPHIPFYNPWEMDRDFLDAEEKMFAIVNVDQGEAEQAREHIHASSGDLLAGAMAGMQEFADLGGHLRPLDPGTKGGSIMFKGSLPSLDQASILVKSIYEHEEDMLDAVQCSSVEGSYVVPIDPVFKAFGLTWGVMPSVTEGGVVYDIKGVPILRYMKKSGQGVQRDPNFLVDFMPRGGDATASLMVDVGRWERFVNSLGPDLECLAKQHATDFSMLVSILESAESKAVRTGSVEARAKIRFTEAQRKLGQQNVSSAKAKLTLTEPAEKPAVWKVRQSSSSSLTQRQVWPFYSIKAKELGGILFGGIVDYLESSKAHRPGRGSLQENITIALHTDDHVYGCRMLFFIATQMLKPCKWPTARGCGRTHVLGESCEVPTECVLDFIPFLQQLFPQAASMRPAELVNPRTMEVTACALFDSASLTLADAATRLVSFVKTQLGPKDKASANI